MGQEKGIEIASEPIVVLVSREADKSFCIYIVVQSLPTALFPTHKECLARHLWHQGWGSGSAWIRTDFGGLDPVPDPKEQKWPTKNETAKKFHVLTWWMLSFQGWRFLLYLGRPFEVRNMNFLPTSTIAQFLSSNPWIWIRTETNVDPRKTLCVTRQHNLYRFRGF